MADSAAIHASSAVLAGMHCCRHVAMVGHAALSHVAAGFGFSGGQQSMSSAIAASDIPVMDIPAMSSPPRPPSAMAIVPPNGMDATAKNRMTATSRRMMWRRFTISACHVSRLGRTVFRAGGDQDASGGRALCGHRRDGSHMLPIVAGSSTPSGRSVKLRASAGRRSGFDGCVIS